MTENCSIPEGYEAVPFSAIFTLGRGLNITKADLVDEGIPCLSYGQIHSKYPRFVSQSVDPLPFAHADNLITNPQCTLQEGDFAFADTSEDYKGAGNFTCVRDNTPLLAGYHTTIARPNKRAVYSPYVAYFFDSYYFRKQIQTQVCGIKVFSITNAILNNTKVWLPDLSAQKRIAKFLDKKLKAIESVIRSRNELLINLTTYRQSLITLAVTKGLDSDHQTPFIPLKYLAKLNPDVEPATSDEIEYLPMEKVKNGVFLHHSDKLANLPPSLNSFADGDILLAKVTPCFENGNICLAENCKGGVGRCSTELFVLRPNLQRVMPKFLMLLLQIQSFKQEAVCQMRGTGGLKRIPADWLCNHKFPVPSLDKQKQIVEYMASKNSNLDGLIKKIKASICLLNDYRSSLISAAVTGQLAIEEAAE